MLSHDTNYLETVREAIEADHITEPTAVDSLHKLKDAFLNEQGWGRVYYLFDADGKPKNEPPANLASAFFRLLWTKCLR